MGSQISVAENGYKKLKADLYLIKCKGEGMQSNINGVILFTRIAIWNFIILFKCQVELELVFKGFLGYSCRCFFFIR